MKMAKLNIETYTAPVLRRCASAVERVTPEINQLVQDMFETMYEAKGIGLAAPQVGILQRIIVCDIEEYEPMYPPMALINPVIIESSGQAIGEEGCLSLPGIMGLVTRAEMVCVTGLTLNSTEVKFTGLDLMARVLQHEMEHLDGVLFIDHFDNMQRAMLKELMLEKSNNKEAK